MISNEPPLQFQTSHPMLFANCSMTCLASAVLGELVLPLLCINRILTAECEQVIFAVWTLNYLNPAACRAFLLPYLLNSKCIDWWLWTSNCFGPFVFCICSPSLRTELLIFKDMAHWRYTVCLKPGAIAADFEPVIASGHLFPHMFFVNSGDASSGH